MSADTFIERLAALAGEVPGEAAVHALEPSSPSAAVERATRLVDAVGRARGAALGRGRAEEGRGRTKLRFPADGLAVAYHASGAVKLRTGLPAGDGIFREPETVERLAPRIQRLADQLGLSGWVARDERLELERVWRIMAGGEGGEGDGFAPVLWRAVGAFRRHVDGVPVWGPASVAVTMAADDVLDRVAIEIRPTSTEFVEKVRVIEPVAAARDAVRQVLASMRGGRQGFTDLARPTSLRFGYLSLPKRKVQEILAPVYVATMTFEGAASVDCLVVTSATEEEYLSVRMVGRPPTPDEPREPVARAAEAG